MILTFASDGSLACSSTLAVATNILFELSENQDDVSNQDGVRAFDIRVCWYDSGWRVPDRVCLHRQIVATPNTRSPFPDAVATDDRLIQTDSGGVLSYAELTIGGNTVAIGAQSVHISNIEFEGVAGVSVGNVRCRTNI